MAITEQSEAIIKFMKQQRRKRGWRQRDLAMKVGATQQHISRLELGYPHPSLALLNRIAKVFGYKFIVRFDKHVEGDRMAMWEVNLDDEQIQLVMLALAQLSLERPGWYPVAIKELAAKFPGGPELLEDFRASNNDVLPVSNVAETCAKIVETFIPGKEFKFSSTIKRRVTSPLKDAVSEIRRYAADLSKPENSGANREGNR